MKTIKCVVVGDEASQKTSVLDIYTNQSQGSNTYDDFEKKTNVDGNEISLHLFDSLDQADYKKYSDVDVFVLCFSLVTPQSFQSIEKTYAPAVKEANPNAHIILVGTNIDERNDFSKHADEYKSKGMEPSLQSAGEELKEKIGAVDYIECSIEKKINIDRIFDQAVRAVTGTKPPSQEMHDKKDCLIC
ncbi:hypothetical protein M9Y10_029785 [Tritrichomonas musculus]|uniref:Uncharacterized protein n=1 Tax=Tritrichomonas musculus TaxID=1915356 RepID=A0ABR2KN22_9EUKA